MDEVADPKYPADNHNCVYSNVSMFCCEVLSLDVSSSSYYVIWQSNFMFCNIITNLTLC